MTSCREGIRRAASGCGATPRATSKRARTSACAPCRLALANGKLGAAHGLPGPLGGYLDAPHGALTAAVMAAVCEFNLSFGDARTVDRYAEVGELLTGRHDGAAVSEWFTAATEELGVPGLADLGLDDEGVQRVADAAAKASSTKGNPVPIAASDLAGILRDSL